MKVKPDNQGQNYIQCTYCCENQLSTQNNNYICPNCYKIIDDSVQNFIQTQNENFRQQNSINIPEKLVFQFQQPQINQKLQITAIQLKKQKENDVYLSFQILISNDSQTIDFEKLKYYITNEESSIINQQQQNIQSQEQNTDENLEKNQQESKEQEEIQTEHYQNQQEIEQDQDNQEANIQNKENSIDEKQNNDNQEVQQELQNQDLNQDSQNQDEIQQNQEQQIIQGQEQIEEQQEEQENLINQEQVQQQQEEDQLEVCQLMSHKSKSQILSSENLQQQNQGLVDDDDDLLGGDDGDIQIENKQFQQQTNNLQQNEQQQQQQINSIEKLTESLKIQENLLLSTQVDHDLDDDLLGGSDNEQQQQEEVGFQLQQQQVQNQKLFSGNKLEIPPPVQSSERLNTQNSVLSNQQFDFDDQQQQDDDLLLDCSPTQPVQNGQILLQQQEQNQNGQEDKLSALEKILQAEQQFQKQKKQQQQFSSSNLDIEQNNDDDNDLLGDDDNNNDENESQQLQQQYQYEQYEQQYNQQQYNSPSKQQSQNFNNTINFGSSCNNNMDSPLQVKESDVIVFDQTKKSQVKLCSVHKRPLEVVCVQCKVKICTNCALFGAHKNHEIQTEEEIVGQITNRAEQVVMLLEQMENINDQLSNQQLEQFLREQIQVKRFEVQRYISSKFQELQEKLKQKQQEAEQELEKKLNNVFSMVLGMPELVINQSHNSQVQSWKDNTQHLIHKLTDKSEQGELPLEFLDQQIIEEGQNYNSIFQAKYDRFQQFTKENIEKVNIPLYTELIGEELQNMFQDMKSQRKLEQEKQQEQLKEQQQKLKQQLENSENLLNSLQKQQQQQQQQQQIQQQEQTINISLEDQEIQQDKSFFDANQSKITFQNEGDMMMTDRNDDFILDDSSRIQQQQNQMMQGSLTSRTNVIQQQQSLLVQNQQQISTFNNNNNTSNNNDSTSSSSNVNVSLGNQRGLQHHMSSTQLLNANSFQQDQFQLQQPKILVNNSQEKQHLSKTMKLSSSKSHAMLKQPLQFQIQQQQLNNKSFEKQQQQFSQQLDSKDSLQYQNFLTENLDNNSEFNCDLISQNGDSLSTQILNDHSQQNFTSPNTPMNGFKQGKNKNLGIQRQSTQPVGQINNNLQKQQLLQKKKKKDQPKFSQQKFENVFEGLKKGTQEIVDFGGAEFGDKNLQLLCEYFLFNQNLKSLKLLRNKITDFGLEQFLEHLPQMENLQSLNLGQNWLTEKSLSLIEKYLQEQQQTGKLKSIILSQNKIQLRNNKQRVADIKKQYDITISL